MRAQIVAICFALITCTSEREQPLRRMPDDYNASYRFFPLLRWVRMTPAQDARLVSNENSFTCVDEESFSLCLKPGYDLVIVDARRKGLGHLIIDWTTSRWIDERGREWPLEIRRSGTEETSEIDFPAYRIEIDPDRQERFRVWPKGKRYFVADSEVGSAIYQEPLFPGQPTGSESGDRAIVEAVALNEQTAILRVHVEDANSGEIVIEFGLGLRAKDGGRSASPQPTLKRPEAQPRTSQAK